LKDDARRHALDAWRISEEVGVRFSGPVALGGLAITAQSIDERRQRLAEGERLLAQGCLSHCHFGFYRDAIDAALASRDWSEAERYAGLLEAYTAPEPMRMIDFQIARGRALAAVGRGAADRAALEACRREAIALSLARATAELDVALAHA
jgi:hypothetical protein